MTIEPIDSPIQSEPEIPAAAEAAAAAVTKTCELGRPLEIVSCDNKYDPNTAAACGRQAVAEKVLAVVGTTGAFAGSWIPITSQAGILDVGDTASASIQLTSPDVFPLQNAVTLTVAEATAAKSLGSKKVVIVAVNLPQVQALLSIVKGAIGPLGMTYIDPVLVPPNATDMTQYAAQATASGADGILPIMANAQVIQLIQAWNQSGTDFHKTHLIVGGTAFGPQDIQALGAKANGLAVMSVAWPSTDESNAGIKQYNEELAADAQSGIHKDTSSVVAWSTVHVIADLLKGSTTMDAPTLLAKLNASGPINRPELAPFNFSQNAFPGNPVFSKLRAFSNEAVLLEAKGGLLMPITDGFVDYTKPFTVKGG